MLRSTGAEMSGLLVMSYTWLGGKLRVRELARLEVSL